LGVGVGVGVELGSGSGSGSGVRGQGLGVEVRGQVGWQRTAAPKRVPSRVGRRSPFSILDERGTSPRGWLGLGSGLGWGWGRGRG
jgi:hypothetical protein